MCEELGPIWEGAPRLVPALVLPPYRYLNGLHPHPVRDPRGHAYGQPEPGPEPVDPADWRDSVDYLAGIDLYHLGYLWEAHERWEGLWKASDDPVQRDFLQGLIQLAAALIKVHVGRRRGARDLARAALTRLERVRDARAGRGPYMGLDPERLCAAVAGALGPVLRDEPWDRASLWPAAPRLLPR